jgi:hypothetical protein
MTTCLTLSDSFLLCVHHCFYTAACVCRFFYNAIQSRHGEGRRRRRREGGARNYLAVAKHVPVLAPSEHASVSNEVRVATLQYVASADAGADTVSR